MHLKNFQNYLNPTNLILVLCVLFAYHAQSEVTNEQTPIFEKYEAYQDVFPIGKHNFTQKVLKNEDACVILFHHGSLKRAWKSLAVSLRGVISFGMVDVNEEPELINKLGYDLKNGHEARIYPYGFRTTKEKMMKESSNPNEVKRIATKSIPNYILDLKNMGIQDFLVDSLSSVPSRFPVIIFTETEDIPALFKVLCLRLERYFNIGQMVNPGNKDLQELGIADIYLDMPAVMVITTGSTNLNDPKLNAVQYSKSSHGDLTYPNVLKFLINVNRQFRHLLPGDNKSEDKDEVQMTEVLEKESEKFQVIDEDHVVVDVHSDKDHVVDNVIGSRHTDEL